MDNAHDDVNENRMPDEVTAGGTTTMTDDGANMTDGMNDYTKTGTNASDKADMPGTTAVDPVTIWDVAAAANVSPTTVSRAFRQPSRVNVKTLGRVLETAKRLGYRSESIIPREEKHLRGLLALVVTDLENPVSAQFARSIQRACAARNFGLMVCDTEEDKASELAIIKRSIPHVDGIIRRCCCFRGWWFVVEALRQ